MPQRDHRECDLAVRIYVEQRVYLVIHKIRKNCRGQLQCGGHRLEVGENRTVVPAEMAIRTDSIFPRVAPIRPCADDHSRSMLEKRIGRRRMRQNTAVVAFSQTPERKISGSEVVNAGFEARKITADNVQFEFVQSASAGCGSKVDFTP